MISASGISKSYGALEVLKGVSLEIKKGEIISIVGASGAGKTTWSKLPLKNHVYIKSIEVKIMVLVITDVVN